MDKLPEQCRPVGLELATPQQTQPDADRPSPDGLTRLLETRPLMFWGGVWLSLFLVVAVSVSSLLNPGFSNIGAGSSGTIVPAAPSQTKPMAQDFKPKNYIPLWLFGAIALSCTIGSVAISKHLSRPRLRKVSRSKTKLKRQPQAAPMVSQSFAGQQLTVQKQLVVQKQPVSQKRSASQKQPVVQKQPVSQKRSHTKQRKRLPPYTPAQAPMPRVMQPSVQGYPVAPAGFARTARRRSATSIGMSSVSGGRVQNVPVAIVSGTEAHALDWGTAGVAEAMDLRKQRSLASWM